MSAKVVPLRPGRGLDVSELPDEALLLECAAGSRAALAELFDRFYLVVRGFVARTPGADVDDLDDLVQATFETIPKAARKFDGRASVKTWLCGVAYNVVRHHIRSQIRQRRVARAMADEPRAPSAGDEDAMARERAERLHSAILALPARLRETFVYVYLEGLAGKDVAGLLGVREGTVWKRLHLARARLRKDLEGVYR